MTKIPPNEFINTDIGKVDNYYSWNNIPTSQIKEFIPEGKSIQELNLIRQTLRDYAKRNNVVILNGSGTGAIATATFYNVPAGQIFYIDGIMMSATGTGAGTSNMNMGITQYSATFAQIRTILAAPSIYAMSYNNPIPARENTNLTITVGANIGPWCFVITGWLEDLNIGNS